MRSVIGETVKSAEVLPVNLLILSSVKIISWSRNTTNPVMSFATFIDPAPFAVLKSSTVKGAVKVITLSLA